MISNGQTSLANKAREVYDTMGERAMLEFLDRNRRPPQGPEHDFQGYVVLADGSTIQVWRSQYRFDDNDNRQAQAAAPRLAATFTRTQALYCHWPSTANLYHHIMKILEQGISGREDDGSDPLFNEPEACARWPELEAELRTWAVNADPGEAAFYAIIDDMRRKAGAILANLNQETLESMKSEFAQLLQQEDQTTNRHLPT